MIIKILFLIFLIGILGSIAVGVMISYHFKKFRLPFDPIGKKILRTYIIGAFIISFLCLIFLILAIIF